MGIQFYLTKEGEEMKKVTMFMVMLGVIGLFLTAGSFAQPGMKWKGSGGWGPGGQYNRMYDPATVETISGVVETIGKIPSPGRRMTHGLHVTVKTAKDTISVHLGPCMVYRADGHGNRAGRQASSERLTSHLSREAGHHCRRNQER